MKNFVMVNVEKYSKDKIDIIKEHNVQRENFGKKINYLLKDKLDENVVVDYKSLDELEAKRIEYLKENDRQDFQKVHVVEFVIALSWDKVKDYLDNGKTTQDIDKGFKKYFEALEREYGFSPIQLSIHKDEGHVGDDGEVLYNYHAHLVAHNFSFDKGKPIISHFRKQDFRDLQTLAQNSFNDVGLDFVRGVDKRDTNAKHLKKKEFVKSLVNKEIQDINIKLNSVKKEFKATYSELNVEKNKVKEIRNLYKKGSEEYNKFNEEFEMLKAQEKEAREQYRKLQVKFETKEELEAQIKKSVLDIFNAYMKKEVPIVGKEFYKVIRGKEFFNKVLEQIKVPLNSQINEIEHYKRENESLKKALENSVPREEHIKVVKAFEIKHAQALKFEKENSRLNEIIRENGLDIKDVQRDMGEWGRDR